MTKRRYNAGPAFIGGVLWPRRRRRHPLRARPNARFPTACGGFIDSPKERPNDDTLTADANSSLHSLHQGPSPWLLDTTRIALALPRRSLPASLRPFMPLLAPLVLSRPIASSSSLSLLLFVLLHCLDSTGTFARTLARAPPFALSLLRPLCPVLAHRLERPCPRV